MSPKPIKVGSIVGVWTYIESIDWEERWLWALVGFHVTCLMVTLLSYGRHNIQATLFVVFLGLAYMAEYINELASQHWQKFARQQYFDSQGMFISLMWSVPLIINCCIMVVIWMWTSYKMLVVVKRKQIKMRMKGQSDNVKKNK